ncbi:hypothetical protein [Roseobacter sp. S98]|uniref:hypothetical protein n=1 Tax=Roseobacter algicola (ex Choi et al. 2025) (nom. illeg.) TaxID=3092138 RepID=UPI0035C6A5A7
MSKDRLPCPCCGEPVLSPELQKRILSLTQNLYELPTHLTFAPPETVNSNGPPEVWAAPHSVLMVREYILQLGLECIRRDISRRQFPHYCANTIVEFLNRGGLYMACDNEGSWVQLEIPEDAVERACGFEIEENFGVKDRFSCDSSWFSNFLKRCAAFDPPRPQMRLYDRYHFMDLALRTPRFWE